ncbi:MAG: hypothetical protein FHK82_11840 [Sedimenticola thiotaurini]|uniref:Uncharacterized protein n=1 Tax=Sedimenticola thiotaurini TaxID=1543721 RepID=A0A558CXK3_9GAMM|nr:MAG: hypothetical protein FHK82_11840 [Sedimenticola thiotaurini]
MTTAPYPQDSTLKRHAESSAFHSQLAWLAKPPTDSTLRRHHAQLNGATDTSRETTPLRKQTTHSAPMQTAQTTPQAAGKRSGLFGFIGRLLGI